jgi:hypothetical protein
MIFGLLNGAILYFHAIDNKIMKALNPKPFFTFANSYYFNMKALRLLFFIPAFFLTLIIGNLLFDFFVYVVSLFRSTEDSQLSFIWDYFLKSFLLSTGGIIAGLYVYPFKNKLLPLILFSLFYIVSLILIFSVFKNNWNEFIELEGSHKVFVSQISLAIGVSIGVGVMWYNFLKDGFNNFD